MSNFFAIPITDEWGTTYQLTTAGYTALVVLMLALLLLACFIGNSVKQPKFSARQLAFSAMAIAAAFVTSEIKLFHLPFGGSITLFSMLFLVLIGYWYGLRAGLMTAIAYGFLQLVSDPYIISIPQMLVDYIFAFGALGLSGLFSKSKNGLYRRCTRSLFLRIFIRYDLLRRLRCRLRHVRTGLFPGLQRHLSVRGSGADTDHPLPASGQKGHGTIKNHGDTEIKRTLCEHFRFIKKESGAQSYRCLTPDSFLSYRKLRFHAIRNTPRGCALGARMCQGTFLFTVLQNSENLNTPGIFIPLACRQMNQVGLLGKVFDPALAGRKRRPGLDADIGRIGKRHMPDPQEIHLRIGYPHASCSFFTAQGHCLRHISQHDRILIEQVVCKGQLTAVR